MRHDTKENNLREGRAPPTPTLKFLLSLSVHRYHYYQLDRPAGLICSLLVNAAQNLNEFLSTKELGDFISMSRAATFDCFL